MHVHHPTAEKKIGGVIYRVRCTCTPKAEQEVKFLRKVLAVRGRVGWEWLI